MTEMRARIDSLNKEIEVLKTRVENAKKEKEKYMLELIKEEKETQESIVSLLDAISRYKETVDVVLMKGLNPRVKCRGYILLQSHVLQSCISVCLYMIDLQNLKFWYDKKEVDEYMEKNHLPIEDLLQSLIESVLRGISLFYG